MYALQASSDTNKTTPKAPSPAPDANKVRVTVYKAYTGGKPFLDNPKAVIVPDTWEEFLASVGRKVNASRVASVETLDTGSVLEELNEIMHGDKLVIRCAPGSWLFGRAGSRRVRSCHCLPLYRSARGCHRFALRR